MKRSGHRGTRAEVGSRESRNSRRDSNRWTAQGRPAPQRAIALNTQVWSLRRRTYLRYGPSWERTAASGLRLDNKQESSGTRRTKNPPALSIELGCRRGNNPAIAQCIGAHEAAGRWNRVGHDGRADRPARSSGCHDRRRTRCRRRGACERRRRCSRKARCRRRCRCTRRAAGLSRGRRQGRRRTDRERRRRGRRSSSG